MISLLSFLLLLERPISQEPHGDTPLMTAALSGDLAKVRALLAKGANVNEGNRLGMTPLMFAVGATPIGPGGHRCNPDLLKELLDRGADVNAQAVGGTALLFAVENGDIAAVSTLLARGADPNLHGPTGTPLEQAAARREPEIVSKLLARGAKPLGYRDANGRTTLMSAIGAVPHVAPGRVLELVWPISIGTDIVATILDHGADAEINERSRSGETALTMAVLTGHVALVQVLLEHGADPNIKDRSLGDATALIIAACEGASTNMVRLLLEKGADPAATDARAKTALQCAREKGLDDTVKLLQ